MLQGDELAAFLEARCGKLTASRMADAMDFRKDGKPGAKRIQLMKDLLAERVTQNSMRHYVTPAMQWGAQVEQEAKDAYEAETGALLTPCGTIDHPTIDGLAATPDALLSGGGLLEAKCPTTPVFLTWRMNGVVPDEHKPQMLVQMACTGRRWCEFVAYDPRVPAKHRLFIRRYEPTADEIAGIEEAARQFLDELEDMFRAFVEAA